MMSEDHRRWIEHFLSELRADSKRAKERAEHYQTQARFFTSRWEDEVEWAEQTDALILEWQSELEADDIARQTEERQRARID